jgi:hypothetical protein
MTGMFRIKNKSDRDLKVQYNSIEYVVPAGKNYVVSNGERLPVVPESVAKHITWYAEHQNDPQDVTRELVEAQWAPKEENKRFYRDPVTGVEYATVEELAEAIEARVRVTTQATGHGDRGAAPPPGPTNPSHPDGGAKQDSPTVQRTSRAGGPAKREEKKDDGKKPAEQKSDDKKDDDKKSG